MSSNYYYLSRLSNHRNLYDVKRVTAYLNDLCFKVKVKPGGPAHMTSSSSVLGLFIGVGTTDECP